MSVTKNAGSKAKATKAKTGKESEVIAESTESTDSEESKAEVTVSEGAALESVPSSDLEKRVSYCTRQLAKNPPTQDMIDAVEEMREAMHGMRGEDNITFPQIKHKNGLQSYEGAEVEEYIDCVIVHTKQENHYYKNRYDPSNPSAPDCFSPDGITPTAEEPVASRCAKCPFNQYGSASDSDGKACKNFRAIYVQVGEGAMPFVIKVPPTSMKAAKEFIMNVNTRHRAYWNVKTRISVYKKNEEQAYHNLRFEVLGKASTEERSFALMIRKETLEFMENQSLAPEEIEELQEADAPVAPKKTVHDGVNF